MKGWTAMLKEAIEAIAKQAQLQVVKPEVRVIEGFRKVLVIDNKGDYQWVEPDRPEERWEVDNLKSLLAVANDWAAGHVDELRIEVGRTEMVFIAGDGSVDHRCRYKFQKSYPLESLGKPMMSVRSFQRWLRSDMLDVIPEGRKLLAICRNLSFRSETSSRTDNQVASKASYGRDIENEVVSAAGSLDEWDEFTISIPVVEDAEWQKKYTIRCYLDVDHSAEELTVRIFGGEADRTMVQFRDELVELVAEKFNGLVVAVNR